VAKHMPSMHKILCLNPNTVKERERKTERERERERERMEEIELNTLSNIVS
jgi:hypothetical protein